MSDVQMHHRILKLEKDVRGLIADHAAPDGLDPNARMFYFQFQERIDAKIGELRCLIINLEDEFKKMTAEIKQYFENNGTTPYV